LILTPAIVKRNAYHAAELADRGSLRSDLLDDLAQLAGDERLIR
jgi:hypothetical protein